MARRQWINAYPEYERHLKELLYALKGKVQDSKDVEKTPSYQELKDYATNTKGKNKSKIFKEVIKKFLHLGK